jgi:hypothetical protein
MAKAGATRPRKELPMPNCFDCPFACPFPCPPGPPETGSLETLIDPTATPRDDRYIEPYIDLE